MTGVWLTTGGTLVVLLLLAGAFLPRPYAEYPLMDVLNPASSAKIRAPRRRACSKSSRTSTPDPSPRTNPSRRRSNGRETSLGGRSDRLSAPSAEYATKVPMAIHLYVTGQRSEPRLDSPALRFFRPTHPAFREIRNCLRAG